MKMESEAGVAFVSDKGGSNGQTNGEKKSRPSYTLPGILHFIQHEWTRFEFERSQWEVERAELQARIAFLQGERKGQENLKKDLVRRIKMLEFALRQERQKYHKLKYGSDLNLPECDKNEDAEQQLDSSSNEVLAKGNDFMANCRHRRQMLLQYLEEIGYTDKVLEMRSVRVRSLLGMTSDEMNGHATDAGEIIQSKGDPKLNSERIDLQSGSAYNSIREESKPIPVRRAPSPPVLTSGKGSPQQKKESQDDAAGGAPSAEDEAMASFNFLPEDEQSDMIDDDDDDRPTDNATIVSIERVNHDGSYQPNHDGGVDTFDAPVKSDRGDSYSGEENAPDDWQNVDQGRMQKRIEQYKNERRQFERKFKRPNRSEIEPMLSRLSGEDNIPPPPNVPAPVPPGDEGSHQLNSGNAVDDGPPLVIPNDALDGIALGDLAGLTVTNESGTLSMEFSGQDDLRKTWIPKYTLRSHFDGVRAVCFHPTESALITASEDHTLKMWTLQKNTQNKRNISDGDPISTFRGHSGPVLCAVVNGDGTVCYSGGIDATIQSWHLPSFNTDQYAPYDPHVLGGAMVAHTDAVWSLALQPESDRLLSCAADGTCRLWNPTLHSPLVCTYSDEGDTAIPTSVTFIGTDSGQMAASYTTAECIVYDLTTAKAILRLDSAKTYNGSAATQINKVISHPTLPILITAHEDRHIRFFDINSGKQVHSMVAHLDAVTSLSVDPSGLFLLSGSHDGSIRLWSLDNKTCIQEITAHRKKFDEAVFDVAFHPSQPFIASAGADALAKVFV